MKSLRDFTFPPLEHAPGTCLAQVASLTYHSTRWTPRHLSRLMEVLESGAGGLRDLTARRLRIAWSSTVEAFAEPTPGSPEDELRDTLTRTTGLSRPGLNAALSYVLRGVSTRGALGLLAQGPATGTVGSKPAVAIMSSNLPALSVQSLLPALALRRPLMIKSASSEPFFTPAFIAALGEREPVLKQCLAAVCFPGGSRDLEQSLFEKAGRVVAYGGEETAGDLSCRLGPRLVMHGPKISLAVLDAQTLLEPGDRAEEPAEGLARDIALFDQRGCLSIPGIFVIGPESSNAASRLVELLGSRLEAYGHIWPPGPQSRATAGVIRQWRDEAVMSGLRMSTLPFACGTVIVADEPVFRPSPGGRTVRIHAVPSGSQVLEILQPWQGRIQGVAVAGEKAMALEDPLRALGASRLAAPGSLQHPDMSTWHNGGLAPLDAFRDP